MGSAAHNSSVSGSVSGCLNLLGDHLMKSKILLAVLAVAVAASPAFAGKAKKPSKHHGHHKAHHVKGWKACKGTYQYLKGGKCLDSRKKPSK